MLRNTKKSAITPPPAALIINKYNNKTFEEKRKSKMMAVSRIKEYRRKKIVEHLSVQDPPEVNENLDLRAKQNNSKTTK